MGCFLSEILLPEDGDGLVWSCCQRCSRNKGCPYICDRTLRYAAWRGRASAKLLKAEADRYLETISAADRFQCLLNGDRRRLCSLSHVLNLEMELIKRLCARTEKEKQ